jgi:hypothetical protein
MELLVMLLVGVVAGLLVALVLRREARVEIIQAPRDDWGGSRGGCFEPAFGLLVLISLVVYISQRGGA